MLYINILTWRKVSLTELCSKVGYDPANVWCTGGKAAAAVATAADSDEDDWDVSKAKGGQLCHNSALCLCRLSVLLASVEHNT